MKKPLRGYEERLRRMKNAPLGHVKNALCAY